MEEEKSCYNCKWDDDGGCRHPDWSKGVGQCADFALWESKRGDLRRCNNCDFWVEGKCINWNKKNCINLSLWKPKKEKEVSSILEHQHIEGQDLESFMKSRGSLENEDNVNHPQHYTQGKIEVIEVIEDWKLNYIEGNIIKYVARYKHKNGKEDLEKAMWYLKRLIAGLDK